MAWGAPAGRGSNQNKTSGTSLVLTIANADITVGEIAFVWAACDSMDTLAGDTSHLSIVDSAGNVWNKVFERSGAVADAHVCIAFWWTKVTTQMTSGSSTITLTIDEAKVAKAMGCGASTIGASKTASLADRVTATGVVSSNSPTVTSGTVSSVERLWLGLLGMEIRPGDMVEDSDYTVIVAQGTTGAPINSNISGRLAYRIATLTSDTYAATQGQAGDWVTTIMAFDEVDDGAPPAGFVRPKIVIPREAVQRASRW